MILKHNNTRHCEARSNLSNQGIKLFLSFFLIVSFSSAFAQLSTTNKKAIEYFENAKGLFDRKIY